MKIKEAIALLSVSIISTLACIFVTGLSIWLFVYSINNLGLVNIALGLFCVLFCISISIYGYKDLEYLYIHSFKEIVEYISFKSQKDENGFEKEKL